MIVAIDGFEWRDRPTGVGRFMKNLLSTLIPAAPEHRFFLFLCAPLQSPPDWPNLTLVVKDHAGGFCRWQNMILPGLIARYGCDRLLAPNNLSPLRPGVPTLVVVHDVSWRGTPRDYSWKQRLSLDLRARWSLRRAAAVVAVSAFSAGEVERWYGIDRRRIHVIHHGLQPGLQRASAQDIAAFRERRGLTGRTVVGFLGAQFGRRHIGELTRAVERLRRQRDAVLLLAGPDRTRPASRPGRDPDWLMRLPWLPEDETALFYSCLDLSCYLSDYEGFGLPPMEALQCGTVPLLLAGSSLSELYSGCALFEASPDPDRLADAMDAFLRSTERRSELLAAWRERSGRFSWDDAAQNYLQLLSCLAGAGEA